MGRNLVKFSAETVPWHCARERESPLSKLCAQSRCDVSACFRERKPKSHFGRRRPHNVGQV